MANPVYIQPTVTASQITSDANLRMLVADTGLSPQTRQISLTEWRKLGLSVINVKQFGAVGDGVADDTTAIQQAINSIPDMTLIQGNQPVGRPTQGRIIYFPAGTYNVSATINIPDEKNVVLTGDGFGTVVLKSAGGTPPNYILTFETSASTQHAVTIRGLTLHMGGIDIGSNNRRFGLIEECQIVGAPVWGIHFGTQCVEWVVNKVAISEGVGGIGFDASTNTDLITLRHCQLIRNSGVFLDANVSQVLVENCDFEVALTPSLPYVRLGSNCVNVTFDRVRLGGETPPNVMVQVGTTPSSSTCGNVRWDMCFFGGPSTTCFEFNNPPKNWTIRDCHFGDFTTVFVEAFAGTLANSTSCHGNYLDSILYQDTDMSSTWFSAGGIGWEVSPRLYNWLQGGRTQHVQQNLIVRTNQLDTGANWLRTNCTPAKNVTGPDGATSGWTISATAGGTTECTATGVGVTGPVTFSVWLKAGTATKARIAINTSSNWETGQSNDLKLTSEWKRFSVTSYLTGSRTINARTYVGASGDTVSAGNSILMAFPQVTAGIAPTPFMENDSTSATLHGDPGFQGVPLGLRLLDNGNSQPSGGYYRQGDLRFLTSPPSKGSPGFVNVASGSPGTWERLPAGGLLTNVIDLGADPTGTVDSASAIQTAFDNAADGSTVLIPVGTYLVSATLNINKGLIVQGMGRGHEGAGGAPTKGTLLRWSGGAGGTVLQINSSGAAATSVHGWVVRDMGFDGNGVTGANGIVLGTSGDASPVAAVGELANLWLYNFDGTGLTCNTAQICHIHDVHTDSCLGSGFLWAAAPSNANTATLIENCRANNGGVGFQIRRAQGLTFVNCIAEQNQDQGFYLETGGTDEAVNDIAFIGCWHEANLQSGGTGRGEFETKSTNASIRNSNLTLINHTTGTPSAGNYAFKFHGATVEMIRPRLYASGQGILLDGGSVGATSYIHLLTHNDPTTYVSYTAGSGFWGGLVQRLTDSGGTIERRDYFINNSIPQLWLEKNVNFFRSQNTDADATNKSTRFAIGHYTNAEEPVTLIMGTSTSTASPVNVGGGSGISNAATAVDIYAAANNTTTTGTKIAGFTTAGITMSDAMNIILNATTGTKLGTATGQKLGFWNATPVVQQVLATGTGKTVDDVITFLQTIGLCKQA